MNLSTTIGRALLAAAMLAATALLPAFAADVSAEQALKAAIVTKIAKFVSWPEGSLGANGEPIRFCVADSRPFFDALSEFDDAQVQGRPISVRLVSDATTAAGDCDVVYFSNGTDTDRGQWYELIAPSPILTFDESGSHGIVSIGIRRNKVRFSIDTDASDEAGLEIAAQLLHLASLTSRRSR